MRRLKFITGAIVACTLSASALAGPTDAELADRIDAFNAWGESTSPQAVEQELPTKLRELTDSYPISELSAHQIGMLGLYILQDGRYIGDAMAAAEAQAQEDGADGAVGEVVAGWLWMRQQRVPPTADELLTVLNHEGLDEALASGRAHQVFEMAGIFAAYRPEPQVKPHLDALTALIGKIPSSGQYEPALLGAQLYDAVSKYVDDNAKKDAMKAQVIASLNAAKAELGDTEPRIAQAIDDTARKLSFIGGPAPALTFNWTSAGFEASNLEDLKGNVVVLDFWATWCGPCIAAFPKVRELVAHYEGYPVKVIGVTSIQGSHKGADGRRINTQGDPAREYELMAEYIDQKDITWPIAFSEQPVGNPDYFVQGIPHLAFIAPDGTIRYNGLNPHSLSKADEIAMIDGMLKEFGLPTPSEPAEGKPTD
ncbi:MAG: TlpA disulfide reductase family protein [Phycisphaerales bacterium]